MKISLCGSIQHLLAMHEIKSELVKLGHSVYLPHNAEKFIKNNDFNETPDAFKKNMYIKKHLEKIKKSDAVLIVNMEKNGVSGYIGGNTFLEMGFAMSVSAKIYILNPYSQKLPYKDEIDGMLPLVINGDLKKIK